MDFYKKIIKTKDLNNVLTEKEYKFVSLQAISTEALKENKKKTLKELVEEINGHLTDLQAISKDIKDTKNKEKCDKLIKQYEECLVKIINNKFSNILITINKQFENWITLTNKAIKENDLEELNELVERMERNFEVMKEIPEVKKARSMENGDEKILEVINKYKAQLNKAMAHINAQKTFISEPFLSQKKLVEETPSPSAKPNKIVLNEVEEKLKQMRQKRLNRLSTFVDQQTKLAEERSRDNSPKMSQKKSQSLCQLEEKGENQATNKSNVEVIKPSFYKADSSAQEKFVKTSEQTIYVENKEKTFRQIFEEKQQGDSLGVLKSNNFQKEIVNLQSTTSKDNQDINNHTTITTTENKESNKDFLKDLNRRSFGKGSLTRSFAERQIENARNQIEKPKFQLKQSNSSKTTPPRTPTQMRKIFNSFNSCVLGANVQKSVEDLPNEFKSHFEQELKNVQIKSTGEYSSFKEKEQKQPPKAQELAAVLPPRVPIEKANAVAARVGLDRKKNDKEPIGNIEKSESQCHIPFLLIEPLQKNSWRNSVDYDTIMSPNENVTITVKRDSNPLPTSEAEKYTFSTFRSSTGSTNENNALENPFYDAIVDSNFNKKKVIHVGEDVESVIEESKIKMYKISNDTHRFMILEPMIAKLEFAIKTFKGLKRDDDYYWLDKLLSKYYVKIDEVTTNTAFDKIEKNNLLERLKKASKDLENRVNKNEYILKSILEEQINIIGMKYGIIS